MYTRHFENTDRLFDDLIKRTDDLPAETKANIAGLLCVSAITVIEVCIKEMILDHANRIHVIFGSYISKEFEHTNAKVKIAHIKEMYLEKVDSSLSRQLEDFIVRCDSYYLSVYRRSIRSSYNNLITNRHSFVHENVINLTLSEVKLFYQDSKEIVGCIYSILSD